MKTPIETTDAPKAIGPYSQGINYNGLVFCSGQIGLNPKTMELAGETAAKQTEQAIKNMEAVLKASRTGLENVLKTTLFLRDMNDFTAVNEVYGNFFPNTPPARSTVEVSRLPKDALVEIECIAHI